MSAFVRHLCLAIVCLFVAGTTLHGVASSMVVDHADMGGGCADCSMPQDAAMACGDFCQLPPALHVRLAASAVIAGRLPQPGRTNRLPKSRPGLPEPHPPKSSVTI